MTDVQLERQRRLAAIAAAHTLWVQDHEAIFDPARSAVGSVYNLHSPDVDAGPAAEADFQRLVAGGVKAFRPWQARHAGGAPGGLGGQWSGGGPKVARPSGVDPKLWINDPDEEVVASNLWSGYEGMQAIRHAIRGTPDQVDLPPRQRALVPAAAAVIRRRLDTAQPITEPLYRGMRVPDKDVFQVGDDLDVDLASATPRKGLAAVYARDKHPHRPGKDPVVMVLRPGVRATNLDEGRVRGRLAGTEEHLITGPMRVAATYDVEGVRIVEVEPRDS